mgnify:CR=1 FL=1
MEATIRHYLPVVITSITGLLFLLTYYFTVGPLNDWCSTLTKIIAITTLFAVIPGAVILLRSNIINIIKRGQFRFKSIVTLISFIAFLLSGITGLDNEIWKWLYNNVFVTLSTAIFSLLAFYIMSAGYRTFRARSWESSILLIVGLFTILGVVPFGATIWGGFPLISNWISKFPGTGTSRGITIGIALGTSGVIVRTLLGRGKLGQIIRGAE